MDDDGLRRDCGPCHLCCDLLSADRTHHRGADDPRCPNYRRDSGCQLASHRPPACTSWRCAWHTLTWLPDECRPDRMGVMLTFEQAADATHAPYLLARAPDVADLKSLLAQDVLWQLTQQLPVKVEIGHRVEDYGRPGGAINPRFL